MGDLRNSGRFERLDMLISADLIKKISNLRLMRNLPVQKIHMVAELDQVETDALNVGRLPTGREMIRHICTRVSFRSAHGQNYICKDLLKVALVKNRLGQGLFYFQ